MLPLRGFTSTECDRYRGVLLRDVADELAGIVNTAFDKQNHYLEKKFGEVAETTKLRERLDDAERKFRKLEKTLNLKV